MTVPDRGDLPDLPRHRREARHDARRPARAARAAASRPQGQGMFSISQPCSQCGGRGHRHRGSLPDLRRRRAHAAAQALPREDPRRRARRQPHPPRRQGRGRAPAAGPPGDLYVVTRVAPSPVFKRKGDNLEVEVPITIVEAVARRRRSRCRRSTARRGSACPPAPQHGTRPAPARRGPAEARRARAAATSTTASRSRSRRRSPRSSSRRSRSFAKVMNGRPARATCCATRRGAAKAGGDAMAARPQANDEARVDRPTAGVFMISVAAELAEHAPADAAHVRGARPDRAEALAEGHAPLLAARTSSGCGASRS